MAYQMRRTAILVSGGLAVGVAFWRAVDVGIGLARGSEHEFLAYPLTVVLPAVLIAILLGFPPAESREGLLMRVGTIIHLLLIMALPGAALHLALGLPVVFLVVELFETRLPARWRDPLARLVIA